LDFPRSDPSVACRRTATLPEGKPVLHFLEPGDRFTGLALERDQVREPAGKPRLDPVGEVLGHRYLRLGRAREEVLLHRGLDRVALGADPDAAARKLFQDVRCDLPVGGRPRSGRGPVSALFRP
jgi:hypothetical protein